MADEPKIKPETEETPSWTPASPMKRLWAWVGVAYMVIFVLLTTYGLAHGNYLTGIGPLMLVPALVGVGAAAIVRYKTGGWKGGLGTCILVSGASFVLALTNIIRGLPSLLAQL